MRAQGRAEIDRRSATNMAQNHEHEASQDRQAQYEASQDRQTQCEASQEWQTQPDANQQTQPDAKPTGVVLMPAPISCRETANDAPFTFL